MWNVSRYIYTLLYYYILVVGRKAVRLGDSSRSWAAGIVPVMAESHCRVKAAVLEVCPNPTCPQEISKRKYDEVMFFFFFECIVLGRNLKKTVSVNPSCHHVIIDPSPLKTQVLITGASAGIGKELALLLAKQGANLALFARRTSAVDTARYIYIYMQTSCYVDQRSTWIYWMCI